MESKNVQNGKPQNQTLFSRIAKEVVFKTPSEKSRSGILIVAASEGGYSVRYAGAGQYGGYVIKPPLAAGEEIVAGLWRRDVASECFGHVDKLPADTPKEFLTIIKEAGLASSQTGELPHAEVCKYVYTYHPVEVSIVKAASGYTVVDIKPDLNTFVTAVAWRLSGYFSYSARGRCYGLCGEANTKFQMIAKGLGLDVYEEETGKRSYALRVKLIADASAVEKYLASRLADDEEEAVEEEAGEEDAGETAADKPIAIELKPRELALALPLPPPPQPQPAPQAPPQPPAAPATPPPPAAPAAAPSAVPTAVRLEEVPSQPAAPAGPSKSELVKIYLLAMRLPSRYADQKLSYEKEEDKATQTLVLKEIRRFGSLSSTFETIRRSAYERISRIFAHIEEYGVWVAVSEEAVREAEDVSRYVRAELKSLKLPDDFIERYEVRAIPVYLEPEEARRLLETAVRHLSADIEELNARIKEAEREQNKRALRRLEESKAYKKHLLEAFKRFLASF